MPLYVPASTARKALTRKVAFSACSAFILFCGWRCGKRRSPVGEAVEGTDGETERKTRHRKKHTESEAMSEFWLETADEPTLYIIHENDDWLAPLRAALHELGVPFIEWCGPPATPAAAPPAGHAARPVPVAHSPHARRRVRSGAGRVRAAHLPRAEKSKTQNRFPFFFFFVSFRVRIWKRSEF